MSDEPAASGAEGRGPLPYSITLNWLVTALFFSPAIGAWWLAQKLEE